MKALFGETLPAANAAEVAAEGGAADVRVELLHEAEALREAAEDRRARLRGGRLREPQPRLRTRMKNE